MKNLKLKKYSIRKRLIFSWFLVSLFTLGQKYLPSMQLTSAHALSNEVGETHAKTEVHEEGSWISKEYFSNLIVQKKRK
jgi:hypothetical protein